MKLSKKISAVLAGALAVSGLAAVTAPSAQAFGPSTDPLFCHVSGISTSVANWATTWSVNIDGSPAAANVDAGDTVTANITYAAGPNTAAAVTGRPSARIQLVQGSTVVQTLVTPFGPDASVAAGNPFPGASLSQTFTAPSAGTYTVRVLSVDFEGYLGATGPLPSGVLATTVYCNANGGPFTPSYAANNPQTNPVPFGATTLNVTGPNASVTGSSNQLAGVTGYVRGAASNATTLSGTNWDASVAAGGFTVALCDSAGANCDANSTNTLVTNGSGAVSGTFNVPAAATTGNRTIKLTQGANTSLTNVVVLAAPSILVSPSSGGIGASTNVSGNNFDPNRVTSLNGAISNPNGLCLLPDGPIPGAPCNDPVGNAIVGPYPNPSSPSNPVVTVTASPSGTFPATAVTVDNPTTTFISAAQTGAANSTIAAYTVNGAQCDADPNIALDNTGCDLNETVKATVLAGKLSQEAFQGPGNPDELTIQFCADGPRSAATSDAQGKVAPCALVTPLVDTSMFATLNPITVTDTRGGTAGWDLTAELPDLTAASYSIDASEVSIVPALGTITAGSATAGISAGAGGAFGAGAVTLATSVAGGTDSDGGTNGGQWVVEGDLELNVPAFQAAGNYVSTLTINLA